MFTNTGRDSLLAKAVADITYVGLIQSISSWRTPTVTEANYTSYARAAITFGAAADTSPAGGRQRGNSGAITFPKNTGTDQAVIGYGFYTDVSAGTLQAIGLLDTKPPVIGTWLASSDVITAYAHGFVGGERVFVLAGPMGAAPDVVAENTAYYVITSTLTTDTFQISSSGAAGAAVNVTTSGIGMFIPFVSQTIAANATPSFDIGQCILQL